MGSIGQRTDMSRCDSSFLSRFCVLATLATCVTSSNLQAASGDKLYHFERQVRPLLIEKCGDCHGRGGDVIKECLYCDGAGIVTKSKHYTGVTMQTTNPCPMCHGRGKMFSGMCGNCHGNGKVEEVILYNLNISKIKNG